MFRLISVLLLLAGLAAAGFGGWQMWMNANAPEGDVYTVEVAPAPVAEAAEEAMVETASTRSLEIPSEDEDVMFGVASMPGEVAAPSFEDEPVFGAVSAASESIMDRLETVPIAHETPASAQFGKSFEVTVAIDATGDDSAADALPGTGVIIEGQAQVSDSVRAIVTGPTFDIEALSPVDQELSPLTENVWRWKVTPTEIGAHELTIELYALIDDKSLPVRTYRNTVTVEISRIRQAVKMAQDANPLTMLIGGIGSVFAGLFGAARFFKGS